MGSAPGILDKLQSSGDIYWDEFAREIWTVLRSSVVKNGAQLFELYSVLLKWRTERSCSGIVVKYDGIITTCGLGRVNSFRIRNDLNRTYMWPKGPLEAWSHLIWSNPRAPFAGWRFTYCCQYCEKAPFQECWFWASKIDLGWIFYWFYVLI